MKTIEVNLGYKQYSCLIEEGIFNKIYQYVDFAKETVIITDDNVYKLYLQNFNQAQIISITPGEQSKSLATYEYIINKLINNNYSRNLQIIAIGGGVVGDLAGFIASTYLRGVKYIQVPTTLLSQIDSSIGGKVAINFHDVKNVLGTFYHPDLVLIDPLFLQTLPKRHFNNGISELIKYALIKDDDLFEKLYNLESLNLSEIIYRALMIKKELVEADERVQNVRHLLNFGHTIGHAIESYYNFEKYLHGEAVAIGMAMITKHQSFYKEITNLLQKYNLPIYDDINKEDLFRFIKNDKKKTNLTNIKVVLLECIGKAYLKEIPIDDLIKFL